MGNRNHGLYEKFLVTRTDGESAKGGKHYRCEYFVLDLTHDRMAPAAIRAYVQECRALGYDALADDLLEKIHDTLQDGEAGAVSEDPVVNGSSMSISDKPSGSEG